MVKMGKLAGWLNIKIEFQCDILTLKSESKLYVRNTCLSGYNCYLSKYKGEIYLRKMSDK